MLDIELNLDRYLTKCQQVMSELDGQQIYELCDDLYSIWERRRFVFVCSNGGAGSTVGYYAEDLLKSRVARPLCGWVAERQEVSSSGCRIRMTCEVSSGIHGAASCAFGTRP